MNCTALNCTALHYTTLHCTMPCYRRDRLAEMLVMKVWSDGLARWRLTVIIVIITFVVTN